MIEQFAEEEAKGQYCRFVEAEDGRMVLEPVKVPAHVKAARAERIRKRELRDRIEQNRARAQSLNRWSVLSLALALAVCCGVCCVYLYLRNQVSARMNTITSLQREIEQISVDNDLKNIRIFASEDLYAVRQEAKERFGMRDADPEQIRYYSVNNQDYMLQFEELN